MMTLVEEDLKVVIVTLAEEGQKADMMILIRVPEDFAQPVKVHPPQT
jgi:adenosylcobinamide amidohydrolase